jgi:NAD(P)-dependent dehydrogenase (short-subunit alcohol dehydrogenase family)
MCFASQVRREGSIMNFKPKPISEQVIVITGASSGIGLVTAKAAAKRDARVVLAARNERDLAHAVAEIRELGGRAVFQVCDVSDAAQVDALAERAVAEFGGIDTWVNNAAVSIYGRCTEVPLGDMRRQFDVNYWGVVHGMLAAVKHLRARGGVIINVASALADRAIPLQGNYCATKHAVKAFTDSLRMELEDEGVPIAITLLKPGSIDTPLFEKAKTLLGVEPQPIPPVYRPDVVAHAILMSAEHPKRDLIVGGMGKVVSVSEKISPRLTDKYMERSTFDAQMTNIDAPADRPTNLYEPLEHDGGARGHFQGRVKKWSAYTEAVLHPRAATGVVAGIGLTVAAGIRALRRRKAKSAEAESQTP